MNSRRRFLHVAGTLSLGSCWGAPAGAQSRPSIIIAGAPIDTAGTMFYANDLGYFKRAGLDVKVEPYNQPGPVSAALVGGSITIASIALSVAATAHARGLPLVMVAPQGLYLSSKPTAGLIVLKDSPLRTAADFSGKTIAVRDLSNMNYYGARAWLDAHGGDSKSVHWIESNDPLDVAAIQAGRIDAASINEPALDDALRGGLVRSVAPVFDAIAPRFLISAYFTTVAYAQAHPEVIHRFVDVVAQTARWANGHQNESAVILQRYAGAPVAPGSTRVEYAERILPSDVQPVLDLLVKYGVLKTPMAASSLILSSSL